MPTTQAPPPRSAWLSFHWRFTCNSDEPDRWLDRIGTALRRCAQRIDGRTSLAMRIDSQPPLPRAAQAAIIRDAVSRIHVVVAEASRAEACELLLAQLRPDLVEPAAEARR